MIRPFLNSLFLITILTLSFFFGCSQKKITPQDTLVVAIASEPSNLNPLFALDASSQQIDQLMYDGLIMIDQNLKIVPHLAESWENPKDTIYRFKLNKDAKFHDGTPVTALHFAHTLQQILDPSVGSPLIASFSNISEVKVIDPYILEIHLKKPQANFLTDFTLIKAMPLEPEKTKDHFVSSGPYQFVKKDLNQIILKRNPSHFKINPKMENIVFKIIKDENTRLLKLKKGEIDLIQNGLNGDSLAKLQNDPKLSITKSPGLTYTYLGFNLKDPILKNKRVRKAIAYAIHREEIIEYFLHNLASPAKTLLSPLNWYYEENLPTYAFDLEKARKLLKEANVPLPIHLEYKTSTDVEAVNIAKLISDHLKQVGIEVEIRTYEWGTFFEDIKKGNFQLFSLRWVGITEPDIYYDCFHSSAFPPGKNRVYYSNPSLDKLLEEGRLTTDPNQRKKIYSKVQKTIAEDLPYVSLWHLNNIAAYSSRLIGFYFHPQGNFLPLLEISKRE